MRALHPRFLPVFQECPVIHRKKKTLQQRFTSRPATCQPKKKVLIGEAQFQFNNIAYLSVNPLLSKTSTS